MIKHRLAKLEQRLARYIAPRLFVATVPPGSNAEQVAQSNGVSLLDSDIVVVIRKPEGTPAGTIREYGKEAA